MRFLRKNSLLILTIYAVCAAVVAAFAWNGLLLTQKCAVVMVMIACLHEWEEQRFPGGFLELMAQNMGLAVTDEQRASMLAKPDLMVGVLTFLGFAVRDVPLFACAVILFGLLEGIVHVAGIKLMGLKRPYSPGLVTAELWAATSVVSIVLLVQQGTVGPLDWALGFVWLVVCFAAMEISVWKAAGISLKEVPERMKARLSK